MPKWSVRITAVIGIVGYAAIGEWVQAAITVVVVWSLERWLPSWWRAVPPPPVPRPTTAKTSEELH